MLNVLNVLVFSLGSAKCAIHTRIFDLPSIFSDSQWSPSFTSTSLDALDPRNQAVSSSYSVVQSSSGLQNPSRVTYTKTEFKPEGQPSERRPVKEQKHERRFRPQQYDDDSSSREYTFDSNVDYESERTTRRNVARPRPRPSPSSSTSPPKSINEIVQKVAPLDEAGSAKSGKFLSGGGGLGEGFEEGYDREKHYDKEGGKKFVEAHKNEEGEKAHKAHKEQEAYDKGEKEQYGKEEKKAVVSQVEGAKKGHLDEEKHHGEQYKKNGGEQAISQHKLGGHQKNHRKTGFHKIHNKNEYKLDEEFDEKFHDGDEKEEHLNEHQKHAQEKAGEAKKNSHDSAYHEAHGEKKELQDKGIHHEAAKGHKKEAAEQEHHDEHSEYGKKGGVKEGAKHGHAEGGGHRGGGGYFDSGGF